MASSGPVRPSSMASLPSRAPPLPNGDFISFPTTQIPQTLTHLLSPQYDKPPFQLSYCCNLDLTFLGFSFIHTIRTTVYSGLLLDKLLLISYYFHRIVPSHFLLELWFLPLYNGIKSTSKNYSVNKCKSPGTQQMFHKC